MLRYFTFGFHLDAHGLKGVVVSENIKRGIDYFGYSDCEAETDPDWDSSHQENSISYYDKYNDESNFDPY